MYQYIYKKKLNINYSAFNISNYSEIPGGNAEFYRDKYKMSSKKIVKFLKKSHRNSLIFLTLDKKIYDRDYKH